MSIFVELSKLSNIENHIYSNAISVSNNIEILNINVVLDMLTTHFSLKLGSRLPVIAIYTIYKELINNVKLYKGKILRPLNVHTSSDKHGYGDIEVWNKNDTPYEIIEIKHNIPIDRNIIFDIVKKSMNAKIKRFYILTTYPNSFISQKEELYINQYIYKIKQDLDMDIIANRIVSSLKYYLRFIDDYKVFIKSYTENLIEDAKNSTEVKNFHIEAWHKILEPFKIDE